MSGESFLEQMLRGAAMGEPPQPHETPTFLRCTGCGETRRPRSQTIEGVTFVEREGQLHRTCSKQGTWGQPDETDNGLSEMLVKEERRVQLGSALDLIANVYNGMTERGCSEGAAVNVTMLFATGNLNPNNYDGWRG